MPTQRIVHETYWGICHKKVSYPCGIEWCSGRVRYPCGIEWCSKKVLGIKIKYPCGLKWCEMEFSYPCGLKWCETSLPYPCRKVSKETKTEWCYDFGVVHESCKVFIAKNYGCENGREYSWTSTCLGWFDVYHPGPITKCFDEPLEDLGTCRELYSIPPGGDLPTGRIPSDSVGPGSPLK